MNRPISEMTDAEIQAELESFASIKIQPARSPKAPARPKDVKKPRKSGGWRGQLFGEEE